MAIIPNTAGDAGIAASNVDSYVGPASLFYGDTPAVVTESMVVKASAISGGPLLAHTPVGLDTGELVPSSDSVAAIGIMVNTVLQGATDRRVSVYKAGHFNANALNWHANIDTDTERKNHFKASAPMIFISKNKFGG